MELISNDQPRYVDAGQVVFWVTKVIGEKIVRGGWINIWI